MQGVGSKKIIRQGGDACKHSHISLSRVLELWPKGMQKRTEGGLHWNRG